jgi:N-terminal acetyltransferase B complex catalytic subunit
VTAVTVAPEFRRLGQARSLMDFLEAESERADCKFVDLYVRKSNKLAIAMYQRLGYVVYRQVIGYYSDNGEDAFDMRKSLAADPKRFCMVPLPHPVQPGQWD